MFRLFDHQQPIQGFFFEVQKGQSPDETVLDPVWGLLVPHFHPNPASTLHLPLGLRETSIPLVPLPHVTHYLWKPAGLPGTSPHSGVTKLPITLLVFVLFSPFNTHLIVMRPKNSSCRWPPLALPLEQPI